MENVSPQSSRPLRLVKQIPLHVITREAVEAHRLRQQLGAGREIVATVATEHGHTLGAWRVTGADRFALIQCVQCGNGARLDLDTAAVVMQGMHTRCAGMAVPRG